jgi:hypothetical protein
VAWLTAEACCPDLCQALEATHAALAQSKVPMAPVERLVSFTQPWPRDLREIQVTVDRPAAEPGYRPVASGGSEISLASYANAFSLRTRTTVRISRCFVLDDVRW